MMLLPLPPYAPELNPIEHVWDELREKHFHNRVFDSLDALEDQLEAALRTFENNAPMVKSIVAWKWIVNALLNYKLNKKYGFLPLWSKVCHLSGGASNEG